MNNFSLKQLGWNNHFQSQLTELEINQPRARITAVHRDAYEACGEDSDRRLQPLFSEDLSQRPTVGDWVILRENGVSIARVLERQSLFKRKRPGTGREIQLIAANINSLFIVTSANNDFRIARLERYLALAHEAGVTPVILITKADMVDDAQDYVREVRAINAHLMVEALDARDPQALSVLSPWCAEGQTIALVGSSGVGKSTLVNSLIGGPLQSTQSIREDDARGRHTTTSRSMHRLAMGAWLVDTPGMRELQITDAADGIDEVFTDVAGLANSCKFSDCSHNAEPGCAVRAAIDSGALDPERLKRYGKLQREDRRNSESLHEAHERARKFGRYAKRIFADKLKRREW